MKISDIETVYKIGIKLKEFAVSKTSKFWEKGELEKWLKKKDDVLLVAKENGELVGFLKSAPQGDRESDYREYLC